MEVMNQRFKEDSKGKDSDRGTTKAQSQRSREYNPPAVKIFERLLVNCDSSHETRSTRTLPAFDSVLLSRNGWHCTSTSGTEPRMINGLDLRVAATGILGPRCSSFRLVGKPYLTGLGKGCPSLGHQSAKSLSAPW